VVSEQGNRFREVVTPSLKHIDYLIINEVEAEACCDMELRDADGHILEEKVAQAAARLLEMGVNDTVVIHFPEGGYGHRGTGEKHYAPTRMLSPEQVLSAVGAGDAFCAGMLYALHEDMPLREGLIFANTCARFNLASATCTGGAPALGQVQEFIRKNY
jgi:sugar/nucleoside kinase (ribokinase family)